MNSVICGEIYVSAQQYEYFKRPKRRADSGADINCKYRPLLGAVGFPELASTEGVGGSKIQGTFEEEERTRG